MFMKKIFLYIFLGLMFCNVSFAIEDLSKVDIDKLKKLSTEEIISALSDKKINGYYQFSETEEPFNFEEVHDSDGSYFQESENMGKISGEWKVINDELCYKYYQTSFSEADKVFDCGVSVYTKYDMVYYFYLIEEQLLYAKTTSAIDLIIKKKSEIKEETKKNSNLSLAEEDTLKAQIYGCWSIPLGLPFNEDLLVRIKLKLNRDGSVAKTEILDHARMNKPGQGFYKVLVESVLRAIKLCQPLKVPSEGYDNWKELILNFDARELLEG